MKPDGPDSYSMPPAQGQAAATESAPRELQAHGVQHTGRDVGGTDPEMMASAASLSALEVGTAAPEPRTWEVDPLVVAAQAGNRMAFRDLFRRHRTDVARVVFRVIGPSADLEDVIQEVFFQVHRSLQAFKGQSKFSTWLHRVAVNVALQHIRKKRASLPQATVSDVPDAPDGDGRASPLAAALSGERLAAVYRVLELLSEKKRVVFVLHDLQGVPAGEIAKTLQTNVLTVRTRLFYARKEFYERIRLEPSFGEGWEGQP